MNIKSLALLLIPFTFAGCATMMSGSTQKINVQAIDNNTHEVVKGTKCVIRDGNNNTYAISSNPGTVVVSKGKGALRTECTKKGYTQEQVGVGQSFNAWTVANVLFWPGLLVDAATGAVQKYPNHITVLMSKTNAVA